MGLVILERLMEFSRITLPGVWHLTDGTTLSDNIECMAHPRIAVVDPRVLAHHQLHT